VELQVDIDSEEYSGQMSKIFAKLTKLQSLGSITVSSPNFWREFDMPKLRNLEVTFRVESREYFLPNQNFWEELQKQEEDDYNAMLKVFTENSWRFPCLRNLYILLFPDSAGNYQISWKILGSLRNLEYLCIRTRMKNPTNFSLNFNSLKKSMYPCHILMMSELPTEEAMIFPFGNPVEEYFYELISNSNKMNCCCFGTVLSTIKMDDKIEKWLANYNHHTKSRIDEEGETFLLELDLFKNLAIDQSYL